MKKLTYSKKFACLLSATMLCLLSACSEQAVPKSTSANQSKSEAPQSGTEASKPAEASSINQEPQSDKKVLVVYFSATGNTKAAAEAIAESVGGELYEIVPEIPYTAEDLDWTEPSSRSNKEHEDSTIRPAIAGGAKDISGYSTVFIGYPIWWGEAPNIVWNFVQSTDLSGKTVIPFATSSSSGLGSSGDTLKAFAPGANWLEGRRFNSGVQKEDLQSWVNELNIMQ